MAMPLVRYFLFVGGTLLGLLFLTNWSFPIAASETSAGDVDRSVIRIHSSHKWPAAVRIDTSMPMPRAEPLAVVADTTLMLGLPTQVASADAAPAALKTPDRVQRRTRINSRWSRRETHRRLASTQPNWLPATW
jgi:hypothetical protein